MTHLTTWYRTRGLTPSKDDKHGGALLCPSCSTDYESGGPTGVTLVSDPPANGDVCDQCGTPCVPEILLLDANGPRTVTAPLDRTVTVEICGVKRSLRRGQHLVEDNGEIFAPLWVKNDWMSLSYHRFDGGPVCLECQERGQARVRWPDGTIEVVLFKPVSQSVTYGDMGHDCEAIQWIPTVTVDLHGFKTTIKLADLLVSEINQVGR